jgi:hypothetical protein
VNIRDKRPIREQIKSGFRLAGWTLLTIALVLALLGSIALVLNKTEHPSALLRATGACGLIALSALLFVSTEYWAKWFVGFLGLYAFKSGFLMLVRPEALYLQFFLLLTPAFVLTARCVLKEIPRKIEKFGFVVLVLSLGFAVLLDSMLPLLIGVVSFALIELMLYLFTPQTNLRSRALPNCR